MLHTALASENLGLTPLAPCGAVLTFKNGVDHCRTVKTVLKFDRCILYQTPRTYLDDWH